MTEAGETTQAHSKFQLAHMLEERRRIFEEKRADSITVSEPKKNVSETQGGMSRRSFLKAAAVVTAAAAGGLTGVATLAEFLPQDEGAIPFILDRAGKLYENARTPEELAHQTIGLFTQLISKENYMQIVPESWIELDISYLKHGADPNTGITNTLRLMMNPQGYETVHMDEQNPTSTPVSDPLSELIGMEDKIHIKNVYLAINGTTKVMPREAQIPLVSQDPSRANIMLYKKFTFMSINVPPAHGATLMKEWEDSFSLYEKSPRETFYDPAIMLIKTSRGEIGTTAPEYSAVFRGEEQAVTVTAPAFEKFIASLH